MRTPQFILDQVEDVLLHVGADLLRTLVHYIPSLFWRQGPYLQSCSTLEIQKCRTQRHMSLVKHCMELVEMLLSDPRIHLTPACVTSLKLSNLFPYCAKRSDGFRCPVRGVVWQGFKTNKCVRIKNTNCGLPSGREHHRKFGKPDDIRLLKPKKGSHATGVVFDVFQLRQACSGVQSGHSFRRTPQFHLRKSSYSESNHGSRSCRQSGDHVPVHPHTSYAEFQILTSWHMLEVE